MPRSSEPPVPGQQAFATTCWSDVRRAADLSGDVGDSLQRLCRTYWYPLYAFLRRSGHQQSDAEDFVQSFFADLLSRHSLQAADPNRGRFRTFLLTACRNHVANIQRAQRAQKRGGQRPLPLETEEGESIYRQEPLDEWSPEKLYERRWALAVIDAAIEQLRQHYTDKGKADRFEALCPLLAPAGEPPTHAAIAQQLNCSVGSVKVAAHRLRQQFAAALRAEIGDTIDLQADPLGPQAIQDELRVLMQALGGD